MKRTFEFNNNKIMEILTQGGATLNNTAKMVDFKKGYQVSKQDCYIIDANKINEILQATQEILQNLKKNEFCGLWVDNNKCYIDISIKINNKQKALEMGRKLKQISIFSWCKKDCIYL